MENENKNSIENTPLGIIEIILISLSVLGVIGTIVINVIIYAWRTVPITYGSGRGMFFIFNMLGCCVMSLFLLSITSWIADSSIKNVYQFIAIIVCVGLCVGIFLLVITYPFLGGGVWIIFIFLLIILRKDK